MMNPGTLPVTTDELAMLYRAAQGAVERAYAPYSGFRVGAALRFDDGATVLGSNVENVSYGLTICAERSALVRAVSERGAAGRIVAVAVANGNGAASPPCGACRQVLGEFVREDAVVVFASEGGVASAPVPFRELFPHGFRMERAR